MARPTTPGERPPGRGTAGFTLIELITVVAIVGILAGVALPQFKVAIIQSREAVLRENLFQLRDIIDQYYVDKGKYPPTLESLVEEGYLRKIPVDPITRAADWVAVPAEPEGDLPGEEPGVFDVKSASTELSLSGAAYGEW